MNTYTASGAKVETFHHRRYENDETSFPSETRYRDRRGGVAWFVLGWEVQPTEDTEWDGIEERTGRILAVMVGDDGVHSFDPEDLTPIPDDAYCASCGQIGCTHDGRERDDSDGGAP